MYRLWFKQNCNKDYKRRASLGQSEPPPRADKRSQVRPPTRSTDEMKRITINWMQNAQYRTNWAIFGKTYIQRIRAADR